MAEAPPPIPNAVPRRSVFLQRSFRLFFIGQLVSNSGTWLQNVAQNSLVRSMTTGSFMVGVTQAAMFLPVLVLALPGGRLADRFDRKRLLIATQVLALLATAGLSLLAWTHHATPGAVIAVALLIGIQYAVAIPATMALLPSLVEPGQLGEAIGMNAITYNLARVLGPAMLSLIIAAVGFAGAFGLNSLSFLALIVVLLMIRGTPPSAATAATAEGGIGEAVRRSWSDRRLRAMLVGVTTVAVAWDPVVTLSPTVAVRFAGYRPADSGLLVAAFGLGAMAAALSLSRALRRPAAERILLLIPASLAFAGGMAAYAFAPTFRIAEAGLVFAGAGFLVASTTWTTAIQEVVPDAMRGRVMAVWTLCFLGSRPIASIADATLSDSFGPRVAVVALLVPLLAVALLSVPRLSASRRTRTSR